MSLSEPKPAASSALADPDFGASARPRGPFATRESKLLIAAAAFQLLVLGWMIGGTLLAFRDTRTVLLKVEPVDPRDLFRGEYVILAYDFGRVPPEGIEGLPGPYTVENSDDWLDRPVFVPLIPEAGEMGRYAAGPPSSTPPPDDVPFLQGTLEEPSRIVFGIETYYVQEGRGAAYETAARDHKLWARVALNRSGQGTLQGLEIE